MAMGSRHPRKGIKALRHGASPSLATSRRSARGFTLTELMIAVVVLIVIILATSRIFSAASRVASIGQATSDVLQDAATIERQIRQDIAALTHEGFFAIRCVEVRNDSNQSAPVGNPTAPLINPLLPPDAYIRADQLMFFTAGPESSQAFLAGQGSNHKAQSSASCVYYGHAFQLPTASAKTLQMLQDGSLTDDQYIDPKATFTNIAAGVYPWSFDPVPTVGGLPIIRVDENALYVSDPGMNVQGTQPNALKWLLTRQSVLLADDGGGVDVFLGQGASAETLWALTFSSSNSLPIRNGRRDAVAMQMNDIRDFVLALPAATSPPPTWNLQRQRMEQAMSYPRAERVAPTMRRGDQALTNSVLGSACSSFRVDWTYGDGVGAQTNGEGQYFVGMVVPPGEQPWFGLDELYDPSDLVGPLPESHTGVTTFCEYMNFLQNEALLPFASTLIFGFSASALDSSINNVERFNPGLSTLSVSWVLPEGPGDPDARVRVYEAFFGYNQDVALGPPEGGPGGLPAGAFAPGYPPPPSLADTPRLDLGYTPWPTAIRVTMTLHDTESRLEAGREFQFVIKLPQRAGTP